MDRRNLLKTMGVAAGSVFVSGKAAAAEPRKPAVGILIDTTKCVGCRTCERVCAAAHKESGIVYEDNPDMSAVRNTTDKQWTVVNRFETEKGEVFVKKQCMHCQQPACASACLTKAMHKTSEGAVAWRGDRCMGCRFCMVSCPFDVPKFEYHSANPRIQKCVLCFEKLAQGQWPACVEHCPAEALTFGPREDILQIARQRIYNEPEKYHPKIYGEKEAGGTGMLYLAAVPFEKLGFNMAVSEESYPALTREFLYAVPVVLTLVPPFLVALARSTKPDEATKSHDATHSSHGGEA